MIGLIDQIKNPVLRAFVLRFYNTIIAGIIALAIMVCGLLVIYFAKNGLPNTLSDFMKPEMWNWVATSVVLSIITAIAAGSKKADRASVAEINKVTTAEQIEDKK